VHESAFSTSRAAGELVIQATLFALVGFVALCWAAALWKATRPTHPRKPLRLVYRARTVQEVRAAAVVIRVPELQETNAGLEPWQRARESGVDEIGIEDLALWSQRSR